MPSFEEIQIKKLMGKFNLSIEGAKRVYAMHRGETPKLRLTREDVWTVGITPGIQKTAAEARYLRKKDERFYRKCKACKAAKTSRNLARLGLSSVPPSVL